MRTARSYTVVDAHSAGTPARVVTGGVPFAQGKTIPEKRRWLMEHHDDIRKLLMYEPRGNAQMSGSILMEPCDPAADFGIVFIEVGGWLTMCGAGTIGAATVVVETGMVEAVEPITRIVFDTPAGLVTAEVEVKQGAVQGVTIENVPSFLALQDVVLNVGGIGEITVDLAYGGNYYAIVSTSELGLGVRPPFAARLVSAGQRIREAANVMLQLKNPFTGEVDTVRDVLLCDDPRPDGVHPVMVFFGEAGVDRSPGGTGTSARMAQRFGRGLQRIGEVYVQESIIGSRFEGSLVAETTIGGCDAVVPRVRGRAFITGLSRFVLDKEDPFVEGFGVGYAEDAVRREEG